MKHLIFIMLFGQLSYADCPLYEKEAPFLMRTVQSTRLKDVTADGKFTAMEQVVTYSYVMGCRGERLTLPSIEKPIEYKAAVQELCETMTAMDEEVISQQWRLKAAGEAKLFKCFYDESCWNYRHLQKYGLKKDPHRKSLGVRSVDCVVEKHFDTPKTLQDVVKTE